MKPPRTLDALGHAVTRYQQRWVPQVPRYRAEGDLLRMLPTATFVEYDDQHEIWAAQSPSASEPVLLVVDDHIVKTVLEPGSVRPNRRPVR